MFKNLPKSELFLGVFFILLGFFARWYRFENYVFGFDQVQILENAHSILTGHLTLIGPRTGPAPLFTGPLIYYLNAFTLFFIRNTWSLVITTLGISVITGLSLWALAKRYTPTIVLYVVAFWAVSPLLITLDRVAWNPNLSLLAGALSFFPLLRTANKKLTPLDSALICLGCFLGYQAHFSGFILPFIVIGCLGSINRRQWLGMVAAISGLVLSLLPSFLFDLRHDWLNTRGILSIFEKDDNVNLRFLLLEGFETAQAMTHHLGSLVFHWSDQPLIMATGIILIGSALWLVISSKNQLKTLAFMSLLWIGIFTLAMSVYRQNKPEYYYLMALPAGLVILGLLAERCCRTKPQKIVVMTLAALYTVISTFMKQSPGVTLSIGNLQAATATLYELAKAPGISKINYNMRPVDTDGLQYLTKNLPNKPDGVTVQVDYPQPGLSLHAHTFDQLTIWIDPRSNPQKNYFSTEKYILESASEIKLFESHYLGAPKDSGQSLVVFSDEKHVGELIVVVRHADMSGFETAQRRYQEYPLGKWVPIASPQPGFVFQDGEKVLVYYPQETSLTEVPDWTQSLIIQ